MYPAGTAGTCCRQAATTAGPASKSSPAACLHVLHIRLAAVLQQALDPLALLLSRLLKLQAGAHGGRRQGQRSATRGRQAWRVHCSNCCGPKCTEGGADTRSLCWISAGCLACLLSSLHCQSQAKHATSFHLQWAGILPGSPPERWPARGHHTPAARRGMVIRSCSRPGLGPLLLQQLATQAKDCAASGA